MGEESLKKFFVLAKLTRQEGSSTKVWVHVAHSAKNPLKTNLFKFRKNKRWL